VPVPLRVGYHVPGDGKQPSAEGVGLIAGDRGQSFTEGLGGRILRSFALPCIPPAKPS